MKQLYKNVTQVFSVFIAAKMKRSYSYYFRSCSLKQVKIIVLSLSCKLLKRREKLETFSLKRPV